MTHAFLEQIENHLNGSISREELEQLAGEEGIHDLDREIRWFKNTRMAIEAEGLKKQLTDLYDSTRPEVTDRKVVSIWRNNYRAMSVAAALILLFGLIFVLRPTGNSQLYSQYEYVDPGIPVLMSETQRYGLYDAMTYYSEENYEVAIEKLEALDYKNSTYVDTAEFYLAASYLYLGKTETCIPLLERVSSIPNSVFTERAGWLKALALLKSGDMEQLRLVLNDITLNPEHTFYKEARSLLEKLDA